MPAELKNLSLVSPLLTAVPNEMFHLDSKVKYLGVAGGGGGWKHAPLRHSSMSFFSCVSSGSAWSLTVILVCVKNSRNSFRQEGGCQKL